MDQGRMVPNQAILCVVKLYNLHNRLIDSHEELNCVMGQIIPVDTSQLDDIVDVFNALPRPYKAPSGMWDNLWSFDLR